MRLLAGVLLIVSSLARASDDGVELHSHLFMKQGMGPLFNGEFYGPLKATSWRDRLSSQANPAALERSGLRLVVAALYAHPVLTPDMREAVRAQIELARRFVRESDGRWVLATDARQAREAVSAGKRVLVLALEGAMGVIETEADLAEFVDRGGIRVVNLLHLTDDLFGGVAFLRGILGFADPWAFFKSLFSPTRDVDGVRVNPAGLTEKGRWMARELLKRHVWLDLAHASDASAAELIPMARQAGQPILYTHTSLRRFLRAERGITAEQLQAVRETKGVVGLMPCPDMLEGMAPSVPTGPEGKPGLPAFLAQLREVRLVVGADGVALGSDTNGGIAHLPPASGTGTSLDADAGFWQIGQSSELWKTMVQPRAGAVLERFLNAWERVAPRP
ncbi:MAG: membrane dipeptidase [Deltaproteobacteria bacterium]|nr:membrane dipeptidase [Deltaproteobacteria bacterium]